ncbi:MAG: sigma-70 family RNA polymerase sigma factor [Phycisphaerales bacterium]|nr:sigma-70 family RNA polymerase sigma factor [Phycisphaerales bacterium]
MTTPSNQQSSSGQVEAVEALLARLNQNGEIAARNELIQLTYDRLRVLTRKYLWKYPAVARWDESGDVCHNALIRLMQAFGSVKFENARHFYNLSARMIRRELLDTKKHYYGAEGSGANHATQVGRGGDDDGEGLSIYGQVGTETLEPEGLAAWTEFHKAVEALPEEEREVTGLVWYQDLSHDEAARLLGVATKTIARRWREARMKLGKWMME